MVVPPATPATIPFVDPTVAIPVLLLDQTPPIVASLSVAVAPAQTSVVPEIDPGEVLTEIVVVVAQPVSSEYEMTAVPEEIPETSPKTDPIVATDVLVLVQIPPAEASVNVMDDPMQTFVKPPIGEGQFISPAR